MTVEDVEMEDRGEVAPDYDPNKRYIFIPIANSDEVVQIDCDELPEDVEEVLTILKAEYAPLNVWHRFAIEYYRHDKFDQFVHILEEACEDEIGEIYPNMENERVNLLNTFAAYNTMLASRKKAAKDDREATKCFDKATDLLNKANTLLWEEKTTWLCKGLVFFAQGDYQRAYDTYKMVLQLVPGYIPALIGQGMAAFNLRKFEEARKFFAKALEENPRCPPDVRLGLAHCYAQLKMFDRAQAAFRRVLDLEPENASALAGLAVLTMNSDLESSKTVQNAMTMVRQAYSHDSSNTVVQNLLANHFFFKEEFSKVHRLANMALSSTTVPRIQGEAQYQIGRAFHAQGDLDSAFRHYHKASQYWEDNPLIQFGLGQLYIYRGESQKAIDCFEAVLKKNKDSHEALKVLGHLYAQTGRVDDAIKNMQRVTLATPDDHEAWVQLGELSEAYDPQLSLDAYTKASNALKDKKKKVPAELYNNIGSMYIMLKDFKNAKYPLRQALAANRSSEDEFKTSDVTTIYNLGRLYEMQADTKRASKLYTAILKDHPNYVDAYVRLACIARAQGKFKEAMMWCEEAQSLSPDSADIISMIATIQYETKDFKGSQKNLEHILTLPKHENDAFSIISLANILYKRSVQGSGKERDEESNKQLTKALKFYGNVLKREKNNLYAANGVAICMAEKGNIQLAEDAFKAIRQATATMPAVWVNQAHMMCLKGHYTQAINLYANVLRRDFDNKDVKILLFIARAHYEAQNWNECKVYLTKAIHIKPNDDSLWFNLGLAQKECAEEILNDASPAVDKLKEALSDLERAKRIFQWLRGVDGSGETALLTRQAETLERLCNSLMENGKDQLLQAQKDAEAREALMLEKQREADERVREKERAAAAELEARKAEEEKQKEIAAQAAEKLERLRSNWVTVEAEQEEKDKKRGEKRAKARDKKSKSEDDDGVVPDDDEGSASDSSSEKEYKGKDDEDEENMEELFGEDSDEGNAKKKKKKGKKDKKDKKKKDKKKKKKKRSHDSDEDEQDDQSDGKESSDDEKDKESDGAAGEKRKADELDSGKDSDDEKEIDAPKKKKRRNVIDDDDDDE